MSLALPITSKQVPHSFTQAAGAFASGDDTPRRFIERCLERYNALEPEIGAFVYVNLERARSDADASSRRWRDGRPKSPIDGMPVGVKDIFETADMPTGQGSPLFAGWRTGRDSAAVAALREAGAVIVGKTVTTEFAATEPGKTRNPWDVERTPGGSSSGSAAAVAAGMVSAALGTQVIGSILRPASFCGCYGFKPSVGALNRGGVYDYLSQSAAGVLAATLDESWLVARAISSRAGGDPGFAGLSGPAELPAPTKPIRVGLLQTAGWKDALPSATEPLLRVRNALRRADIEVADREDNLEIESLEREIQEAGPLSSAINAWEVRWPLNTYARDLDRDALSKGMLDRLERAEKMTLEDYQAFIARRQQIRGIYGKLASRFQVFITLAAPGEAPRGLGSTGNPAFVVPGSLLGAPAISMPLLRSSGLPLGLQALGFIDDDAAMMGHAHWLRNYVLTASDIE